ncbi:MAG: apolipoprotein N-acyltransferase [Alphaproteobacteria bacterium]|nr:apolipoprotein N-acyltransferase [Alphaproteobacteria bacterium]
MLFSSQFWSRCRRVLGRSLVKLMLAHFVLGGLVCLALPPVGFYPILGVIFPLALWTIQRETQFWRVFWLGWSFGLGFFVFGLYWITNAVLIGGATYLWAIPFALFGLPSFLAFFIAMVFSLWHWLGLRNWQGVVVFAILWTLAEYLRGHILTGLPWNLIAYSVERSDSLRQGASLVGAYGVSLAVVLVATVPILLSPGSRRRSGNLVATGLVVLLGLGWWGYGSHRLSQAQSLEQRGQPRVKLRLIQPNIPQAMGYDLGRVRAIIRSLRDLSFTNLDPTTAAILWPEGATELLFEREAELRKSIAETLPKTTKLITGTPRATILDRVGGFVAANQRFDNSNLDDENEKVSYSNGLVVFNHNNEIEASYDKYHLVPFGEYIPFADFLPLQKLVQFPSDFTAGPGPKLISVPGLPPFIPMICYEGIFPGAHSSIEKTYNNQASWLLSVTNDAWFGASSGPYQHLVQNKWRGVEEGLPMVRVANTGVSAVSDSFGRIVISSRLNATAVIDVELPNRLQSQTLYAKYQDRLWLLIAGIVLVLLWLWQHGHNYTMQLLNIYSFKPRND